MANRSRRLQNLSCELGTVQQGTGFTAMARSATLTVVNKQVYVPQINDLLQINLFCNPDKELHFAANERGEAMFLQR